MPNQVPVVPSGGTPMPYGAPNVPPLLATWPYGPSATGGFLPTYGTTVDPPLAPSGTSPAAPDKQPGGLTFNAIGINPTIPAPFSVQTVAPATGPAAGGTSVTLTGLSLTGVTAVKFNGVTAALGANTATTQVVTTPALPAGTRALITVTGPNGTYGMGDAFLYT
jgi:hypothetical protein